MDGVETTGTAGLKTLHATACDASSAARADGVGALLAEAALWQYALRASLAPQPRVWITLDSWHCAGFWVRVSPSEGLMCKTFSFFSMVLAEIQGSWVFT